MKKHRKLISLLSPLIILFILACICSGTGTSEKKSGSTAAEEEKNTPSSRQIIGEVGEDVIIKDMRWKILEVKDLGNTLKSDNQFTEDLTTSGKFIMVRFEYENQGKKMKSLSTVNIIDNKDREYTPSSDAYSFISDKERIILLENINPGIIKIGVAIFDVAPDANGLKYVASDLELFSNEKGYIDLGLFP